MAEYRTYITGLDDCLKCFDQAPKNLLKVVKQAVKLLHAEHRKRLQKTQNHTQDST